MARVFNTPECRRGCCICETVVEGFTYGYEDCKRYSDNHKYVYIEDVNTFPNTFQGNYPPGFFDATAAECERFCQYGFPQIGSSGPGAPQCSSYYRVRSRISHWNEGRACCPPMLQDGSGYSQPDQAFHVYCGWGDSNNNPDHLGFNTPENYQYCLQLLLAANCNVGCCMPATPDDPKECLNLYADCCRSLPGTSLVGTGAPTDRCTSRLGEPDCGTLQGCCLCDWCCDIEPSACRDIGGCPMGPGNLCDPSSPGAVPAQAQLTRNQCAALNRQPPCRQATYRKALIDGRWEYQSVWREKPVDVAGTDLECVVSRGFKARGVNGVEVGRWFGHVCNKFNARCDNTLWRRPGAKRLVNGRWQTRISMREPCPEPPCSIRLGCPTGVPHSC